MEVIGTITKAHEDDHGLWIHADLLGDAQSQDVRGKVLAGAVRGFSAGYSILNYTTEMVDEQHVVNLTELKIQEGTVTVRPANELAEITSAKTDEANLLTLQNNIKQLEARIQQLEAAKTTGGAGDNTTSAVGLTGEDLELVKVKNFLERMKLEHG